MSLAAVMPIAGGPSGRCRGNVRVNLGYSLCIAESALKIFPSLYGLKRVASHFFLISIRQTRPYKRDLQLVVVVAFRSLKEASLQQGLFLAQIEEEADNGVAGTPGKVPERSVVLVLCQHRILNEPQLFSVKLHPSGDNTIRDLLL